MARRMVREMRSGWRHKHWRGRTGQEFESSPRARRYGTVATSAADLARFRWWLFLELLSPQ
ncbi:MAG: hypothetical protein D6691_04515 [Candidatus Hydrogenedentota bacterium]|uniref:Uncharacterized protein n=1 Tax=Sumerlaea chitinivorans TaxID=2250252 RepID=A0A2Z4Y724_SUMC1|nr:hypothetical protein BRCON_2029 [Candidatus Sumerlaea chitinivorans]RMH28606.1 MAG: hypothetical protein D6691_04515 [Candidatus Hydrogenedentota bacterium]